MKKEKWFYQAVAEYKNDVEYLTEVAILDVTEKIAAKMKEQNLSRAELAKRLGVSKAFITKVLGGYPNLTIRSMVSLANALGGDLSIDILQKGFQARKIYYYENKAQTVGVKPDEFTQELQYLPSIAAIAETNGEDIYASVA